MVRCRAKSENYSYDFAASLQNTNEQSILISEKDLTAWKGAAERMLTNEIVLKVFSDYLARDTDFEVILTSRGYTVMGFDNHRQDWNTVDYCPTPEALLDSLLARTMLSNSEFVVMLNQAPGDQQELAKLFHISQDQMGYISNADAGCGLIRYGSTLIPFENRFPRDTDLYRLMTTRPNEKF